MAQTSLIYHYVIIWPSSVTLTFNLPNQMFQMAICADYCSKPLCFYGASYDGLSSTI